MFARAATINAKPGNDCLCMSFHHNRNHGRHNEGSTDQLSVREDI
jgi:hypothetical protein